MVDLKKTSFHQLWILSDCLHSISNSIIKYPCEIRTLSNIYIHYGFALNKQYMNHQVVRNQFRKSTESRKWRFAGSALKDVMDENFFS